MDAIAQAGAGAQQAHTDWSALKAAAGSGELFFEPDAAEKCAQVCQDAADKMEDHLRQVDNLARVAGFGDPVEGRQLADKFRAKAEEAVGVIKAHRQVLWDMRDTYRAAGKAYANTESGNRSQYRGTQ